MKEKVFYKIFGLNPNNSYEEIFVNPYLKNIDIDYKSISGNGLSASIGRITPKMCLGHFSEIRALPVAILSQCLLNSSYKLISTQVECPNPKFVLKSAKLEANQLAISGQYVDIVVHLTKKNLNSFSTLCIAKNQLNEIVGEMACNIELPIGR